MEFAAALLVRDSAAVQHAIELLWSAVAQRVEKDQPVPPPQFMPLDGPVAHPQSNISPLSSSCSSSSSSLLLLILLL